MMLEYGARPYPWRARKWAACLRQSLRLIRGTEEQYILCRQLCGLRFDMGVPLVGRIFGRRSAFLTSQNNIDRPVPLTLIGIMLGHWMFGASFTATSMIGFIALAGIIVRNSILLVDFIQGKRGTMPLGQVLLEAGAIRFKPILLTAACRNDRSGR